MSPAVPLTLLDQRRPRDPVELDAALDCAGEAALDLLLQGHGVEIELTGLEPSRPATVQDLRREVVALQSAGRGLLQAGRRPLVRLFVTGTWPGGAAAAAA